MKSNSKLLVGIVFVLLISSYFALKNNRITANGEPQLLVPELQDKINDVDGIVLAKDGKKLHLNKAAGVWHLQEAHNYLADTNKIASLLLDLRKFKMTDRKTSNPKNYKNLALADSGVDAATIIKLAHGNQLFADISLGKKAQKSQGTYVRKNSEQQTWLAMGQLNVSLEANDWIVNTILDIAETNIQSVVFTPANGTSFEINKLTPKDENFTLKDGIPENMQLKSTVKLKDLATGMQKFKIDSIADVDLSEKTSELTVRYKTFIGIIYRLEVFKVDDKLVLSLKLENADTASDFDKQLQNWHYYIPSYKYDALNKNLNDLIEPLVAQDTETEKKN